VNRKGQETFTKTLLGYIFYKTNCCVL